MAVRTDGDTWDIVSSVGRTALGVAAFRALESQRPEALIEDRYARWFVEASGDAHFTAMLDDPSPPEYPPYFFPGFMGIRTRFFDEQFAAAAADGVTQAVLMAAGLDARAYRLDWPPGAVVFEVDQPRVLEFKAEVLAAHGAEPRTERRVVPVDLREDWPAALVAAGFDPTRPTAWSVEGLLMYLPGAAHDALFERIDGLSAAGSRIAVDGFESAADFRRFTALREKYFGDTPFGDMDILELVYDDERADPAGWLTAHGWSARTVTSVELGASYGMQMPEIPDDFADLANAPAYLAAAK